jgi:hypothetical protein
MIPVGYRVRGLGLRVRVKDFGFWVQGSEISIKDSGFRVRDAGFEVQGSG